MNWLMAVALALAALGAAILCFRVPKAGWTSLATALMVGLAGYALQAQPRLPGAPAQARGGAPEADASLIAMRRILSDSTDRPSSDKMIVADAMTRQGQYANAATLLGGAVRENPDDAEAWLALANALVDHAEGQLTPPASFAYRRAAAADTDGLGAGYFLGFAYIRQGRLAEAVQLWRETLDSAAPDAPGREEMSGQVERLELLLSGQMPLPAAPQG